MWTFPTTDRRGFLCRDILIILAVGLVVRYVVGVFLTYSDDVQSWALTIANFEKPVNDFNYALSVGTHTVSIAANSGYDATNATITFNGQTVQNGGTITVTADMANDGFTLAASGAVAMSSGGSTTVVSGDDGMGLTDYLLIILVVLIVIMAIMVAMRLMRS